MSSSEENVDGVVMLLAQLRSRLDDETDDAEPCDDTEPAVRSPDSSSLKRSKAVRPVQLRLVGGTGQGRGDQLGITQSWTNLADALS